MKDDARPPNGPTIADPGPCRSFADRKLAPVREFDQSHVQPIAGLKVDDPINLFVEGKRFVLGEALERGGLTLVDGEDIRRLVNAARGIFTDSWTDGMVVHLKPVHVAELTKSLEPFDDLFMPDEPSDPAVDWVEAMIRDFDANSTIPDDDAFRDLAERIVTDLRDQGVVE